VFSIVQQCVIYINKIINLVLSLLGIAKIDK
jgi:hypothetical protein